MFALLHHTSLHYMSSIINNNSLTLFIHPFTYILHSLTFTHSLTFFTHPFVHSGDGHQGITQISVTQSQLSLAWHFCAHQPMASYSYLRSKPNSLDGNRSFAVGGPIEWNRLPSTLHDCSIFSLDLQEKAENSSISNYGQQKCVRFGVCLHFRAQY